MRTHESKTNFSFQDWYIVEGECPPEWLNGAECYTTAQWRVEIFQSTRWLFFSPLQKFLFGVLEWSVHIGSSEAQVKSCRTLKNLCKFFEVMCLHDVSIFFPFTCSQESFQTNGSTTCLMTVLEVAEFKGKTLVRFLAWRPLASCSCPTLTLVCQTLT